MSVDSHVGWPSDSGPALEKFLIPRSTATTRDIRHSLRSLDRDPVAGRLRELTVQRRLLLPRRPIARHGRLPNGPNGQTLPCCNGLVGGRGICLYGKMIGPHLTTGKEWA